MINIKGAQGSILISYLEHKTLAVPVTYIELSQMSTMELFGLRI